MMAETRNGSFLLHSVDSITRITGSQKILGPIVERLDFEFAYWVSMAVRKVDWVQKVVESFRQTLRNASGYRKYGMYAKCLWLIWCAIFGTLLLGLRAEDTLSEEDPDVAEGIKKLPKEEYLLRLERLRRANDLSMKHRILARDQWTKPEEVRIKDKEF